MRVSTTELYDLIKARPGRYISHDAGDCRLCEADGERLSGLIPLTLIDALQDQGRIVYGNGRYTLPEALGPIVVEVDDDA